MARRLTWPLVVAWLALLGCGGGAARSDGPVAGDAGLDAAPADAGGEAAEVAATDAADGAADGAADDAAAGDAADACTTDYAASLTADFAARDLLPQTDVPEADWAAYGSWGPPAATYPAADVPCGVDAIAWKRDRVIAAAEHFVGTPYAHKHIPQLGIDCSNFTAWAYNYGLGVKFTSSVTEQADTVGRRLDAAEPLAPGDLVYVWSSDYTAIGHVALYIDAATLIDSTSGATPDGVAVRGFTGWYATRFAHARRVIE